MKSLTDAQILERVALGEISLYEEFVTRYQGRLYKYAKSICKDHDWSVDCVQEVFVWIYFNLTKIDPSKNLMAYLYTSVKNKIYSKFREQKNKTELNFELESADLDLYEDILLEEKKSEVRSGLKKLPGLYRRVLELVYFDDSSYEEVSKELDLPINTVRTKIRRAKLYLKRILS